MQRNKAIDAVKGFAILLVMLGHCIVLNGLNTTDPYIYDMIQSVQMPLFMLVSGVLAGMSRRRPQMGKRAIAYLLPFFSWFVVVYFYTHIVAGTLSVSDFLTELRLLLFQTDRGLWFLMTLFIVTLMVVLAQLFADRVSRSAAGNVVSLLLAAMVLYGLFFLQSRSTNTFLSPSLTVRYFPFYFLGYIGSRFVQPRALVQSRICQKRVVLCGNGILLLLLAAFLGMAVTFDLNAPITGIGTLLLQMTASLLGTLVCFFGVYELASLADKGILAFLGQYTLEIYVLHFRFARLLRLADKNLQFYSLAGFFWLLASFALMSALTFVCIFLIKKVWVLDLLLFGKQRRKVHQPKAGADKPKQCTSSGTSTE